MTLAAFVERARNDRENWKYTDLKKLLKKRDGTLPKPGLPISLRDADPSSARLVFLNGVWQPKMSRFGTVPSCILMGDLESGYSLTLGEETCLVAQPIELVFVSDDQAPDEISLKFSVDVGHNGRLTVLENFVASKTPVTFETNVTLAPSAKLVHGKIVSGGTHLAKHQVRIASGGYYSNFSLLRAGKPIRNEFDVALEGPDAQTSLNGIMLLRGDDHIDATTKIVHRAPQGTSRQVYKTVLDDKAHGVFQGKITVEKDAQKTDGYQLSRALLLSDQAEMDSKPELEIFADDVKCSHGSAIGDLDENALFYLRSRGLNEAEARALLIEGFVSESLEDIKIDAWRDLFRAELEEWNKK